MKEVITSRILRAIPLLIAVCLAGFPAQAQYGGGSGEPNDPYLIYTAEQMNAIGADANDWDKHFKLMADIDLSAFTGTDFNIIGNDEWVAFRGVFDGNGRTISNFSYTSADTRYVGLFGYVQRENALIKDLGLINPNINAGKGIYVGLLAGSNGGTISNCYAEGGRVSGEGPLRGYPYPGGVGGLVGYNYGTISDCSSAGSVSGTTNVGGLVGFNCWGGTISDCSSEGIVLGNTDIGGLVGYDDGTITNCYSTGSVSGYERVGGLVGDLYWSTTITNCYSTGSVTGTVDVGGLVGSSTWGVAITNCYSTGSVTGSEKVGGLVGALYDYSATIANCYSVGRVTGTTDVGGLVGIGGGSYSYSSYWDTQTSGQSSSDGGTGKTTAEMQMASTFIGWGYEPVWMIDEGANYPKLAWENMPGQMLTMPSFPTLAGSGTESDPYLIHTAEQLNVIGVFPCEWDKQFKLMADIDLAGYTGTDFNIIGNAGVSFTGVFDGNGHTISNFTYNLKRAFVGIFGVAQAPARIKALGLINPNVDGGWYTGSLVGELDGVRETIGTITNCYVVGGRVAGGYSVGGLVGISDASFTITDCYSSCSVWGHESVGGLVGALGGTITNCYATGDVTGESRVGGLVGSGGEGGTITNCYATGSVSGWGNDEFFGGLVGSNYGTITNCYSLGIVSGNTHVGGLAGALDWGGTITNCYSVGSVTGGTDVGGLVGVLYSGTITNCYSIGSVSGNNRVGGLAGDNWGEVTSSFWDTQTSGQVTSGGGTGKTTAEMWNPNTFTDAGWDFVGESTNGTEDIWWILEGQDYPRVWWEFRMA